MKQVWVKKMRQMIQDTYFSHATLSAVPRGNNNKRKGANSRHSMDGPDSLFDGQDQMSAERGSLASFGSGNTTDSAQTTNADSQRNTVRLI